jgi:hypothetical protein
MIVRANVAARRDKEEESLACTFLPFAGMTRIRFEGLPSRKRRILSPLRHPQENTKPRQAGRACQTNVDYRTDSAFFSLKRLR